MPADTANTGPAGNTDPDDQSPPPGDTPPALGADNVTREPEPARAPVPPPPPAMMHDICYLEPQHSEWLHRQFDRLEERLAGEKATPPQRSAVKLFAGEFRRLIPRPA